MSSPDSAGGVCASFVFSWSVFSSSDFSSVSGAGSSGFGVSVQQRRPLLPAQRQPYASVRVVRMQAELAAVPDEPAPVTVSGDGTTGRYSTDL